MATRRLLLGLVLALAACSADGNGNGNGDGGGGGGGDGGGGDGGGGPPGGGSGMFPPGGTTFPWPVFDGTVPDVPPSTTGRTLYCDPANGSDGNDGSSLAKAKKTLNAALPLVSAGDTILLAGGLYRERPDFTQAPSGSSGKPITIGSYGHGTGAPILDGGIKPNTWTKYTASGATTVWQSSTAGLPKISGGSPVLSIYVNNGKGEFALREVIHGQVTPYSGESLPPNQNQTNLKDNSNNWYFDAGAQIVYADFGGTLGTGDPNAADVSLLYSSRNNHEPLIVLLKGQNFFSFTGLNVRAASWHGLYSESSNNTVDHCDFKFNGGGGVVFATGTGDNTITGNSLIQSRIWMNVQDNWPRFNNANTGGGWPAALSWFSQSNALARGNVIYQNGGEGLILWGTNAGHTSVNNQVHHNIIFDNFSVNLYMDNTQGARLEQNFVFDHPRDASQTFDNLFTVSAGYNGDFGKRITPVNLSLADEPGSADDGRAHLSDITAINNIFAGCKFGFIDYDDGTTGTVHGLKNCVIANNTFVMGDQAVPQQSSFGWRHGFAGSPDASNNSFVQNNLFLTTSSGDHFIEDGITTAAGITTDYNLYSGPGKWMRADNSLDFSGWKGAYSGWDTHSLVSDAMLADPTEFGQTVAQKLVYDWSKAVPKAGSPAYGAGTGQQFTTDFTNATRSGNDLGAVGKR